MTFRSARLMLVLAITLSALAVTPRSSEAIDAPIYLYFPWVPNGAMLGEMGPFYGAIVIQNLEGESITANVQATAAGVQPSVQVAIAAYGSRVLSAADIGVPAPGSAVFVSATKASQGDARIAGVMKQAAPAPLETTQMEARAGAAHTTVDGYTGMTENDLLTDSKSIIPIVQSNSGWNTVIRISNLRVNQEALVSVTILPAGGGVATSLNTAIAAGETLTFDLQDYDWIPAGFVGAAMITGHQNVPLAAVAERYKVSTNMLIISPGRPVSSCHTTHLAPLVFNNYHHWNTGISIYNHGEQPNEVIVSYYAMDGEAAGHRDLVIPPGGMDYVYTPATGEGESFVGSAVIVGDEKLCAIVDEVKYFGDQPDVGHAMSYPTSRPMIVNNGEGSLALPLMQKGYESTGHGDTSGIQIVNVSANFPTNVTVDIRDEMGAIEYLEQATLQERRSHTVYAMSIALPEDFLGSARVASTSDDDYLPAAISNNVNYAVQYDGSASYTLVPFE